MNNGWKFGKSGSKAGLTHTGLKCDFEKNVGQHGYRYGYICTHGSERGFYRVDMLVYLSLRNGVNTCRIVTRVILVILCLFFVYCDAKFGVGKTRGTK